MPGPHLPTFDSPALLIPLPPPRLLGPITVRSVVPRYLPIDPVTLSLIVRRIYTISFTIPVRYVTDCGGLVLSRYD